MLIPWLYSLVATRLAWPGPRPVSNPSRTPSAYSENLTKYIQEVTQRYAIPGLAVVSVQQNEDGTWDEYRHNFGVANAQGDPVTDESLFSLASNSKLFTYFAIGLLIENRTILPNGELLGWRSKICDVLPGWGLEDPYASKHVDITDLLSHKSGLPRHDFAVSQDGKIEDVVMSAHYLKPSYEIRQQWQYNNLAYITVSHIVTVLSGTPFQQYVKDHIFSPLNMTHTYYNATEGSRTGHLTDGFLRVGRNLTECQKAWKAIEHGVPASCLGETRAFEWWTKDKGMLGSGAGGVIIPPVDMTKWIKELVEPKVLPRHLLERADLAVGISKGTWTYPDTSLITYGQAQMQWTYRGVNLVGHDGSVPGQRSTMIRVPAHRAALMITTNDEDLGTTIIQAIAYRIVEAIAGLTPSEIEERQMGDLFTDLPEAVEVPAHPFPPPEDDDIEGIYYDRAYGNITLHRLAVDSMPDIGSALSKYVPINTTGPVYATPFEKLFTTHLVFTHFSGNVFNWTTMNFWQSLGGDRQPSGEWMASLEGPGSAVLDGKGIGMFGDFWGATGENALPAAEIGMKHVKERAEVWFDKLD